MQNILIPLFLGLANRARGGALKTGSTQFSRLLWGVCVASCAFLLGAPLGDSWKIVLGVGLGMILVPHAFAMGAGRLDPSEYPNNLKFSYRWPGFFLPIVKMDYPEWKRILIDAIGMGMVGLVRGLMVLPFLGGNWILGLGALVIGHFIAYDLSWRMPITIPGFALKKSTEWGEVIVGIFWGIALILTY